MLESDGRRAMAMLRDARATTRSLRRLIISDAYGSRRASGLRRAAIVEVQDAAEAFTTRDRRIGVGVLVGRRCDRRDQPIVEPLVIALEMIVLGELRDREAEVAFTERNKLVEAFGFDREREPFGDGIQVGALRRQLEARDAGSAEDSHGTPR